MPTARCSSSTGAPLRRRLARATLALTGVLVLAASASNATSPEQPDVEFWTIAPNEGQSSGGHSAIRIEDSIYHFEHRGDGLIQIRRDRRRPFERAYRGRGNRRIDVLRLALPGDVIRALETSLRARTQTESILFARLETLDEDLRFLQSALDHEEVLVPIPALGIFDKDDGPGDCLTRLDFSDPERLRADIERAAKQAQTSAQKAVADLSSTRSAGRTRQIYEAASLVEALRVVQGCRVVSPASLSSVPSLSPDNTASEEWRLVETALRNDLTRLIESTRPDRGLAILLTWGRLQAAHESLRGGQIVVLDSFDEGEAFHVDSPEAWRDERVREERRARGDALADLSARRPDLSVEPFLDRLERAQHDALHAEQNTAHRRSKPIGILKTTRALERRAENIRLRVPLEITDDPLRSAQARLLRLRTETIAELRRAARYSLLTQNCVTELLKVLDEALALHPSTAGFAQDRRADLESPLAFVPVAAHRIVARNAPIKRRMRLPGTRELAIAREHSARAPGFDPSIIIREASPRTSRHYRPHPADSTFLFFTDRTIWTRPLGGLANLATSTLMGVAGLLTLPFDRGQRLWDSAMGFSMSIPELFFFNIRKGSYPTTPPMHLLDRSVDRVPAE